MRQPERRRARQLRVGAMRRRCYAMLLVPRSPSSCSPLPPRRQRLAKRHPDS